MEVKFQKLNSLWESFKEIGSKIKANFVKKSDVSDKKEFNIRSFKILLFGGVLIFILVTFLLPTEEGIEFTQKIVPASENHQENETKNAKNDANQNLATQMWSPSSNNSFRSRRGASSGNGNQINYNTSMIVGVKNGNAKTQLRAGIRIPLRILDKFIVSQESVPILAESILDSITDSGLRLPVGTRFYGEASFQKGSERASIQFRQISLPNGEIRSISGLALSKDGQPGILGQVSSDGTKNMMGSLITTFVAGYASGSMETDILGHSKGGVENGLKSAIAATAKDKANSYGEKLKMQREWIEVNANTECDILLNESMSLQSMGSDHE
jgi:hypothetical protein